MQRLKRCWTLQWQLAHVVANGALATMNVLQDNVLPRITRVATRIISQHQEVVATCAIATPNVWLL